MDVLTNREAEKAIIGLAMQDYACAVQLSALADDFFSANDTKAIHRAIRRCLSENVTPELITLSAEARKELADPEALLIECMQVGFSPAMFGRYLTLLDDCRMRRAMKAQGANLIAAANDPATMPLKATETAVEALQQGQVAQSSTKADEAVVRLLDSFYEARQNRCFTGIADLDRITGGIRGGKLIVIGARPGVGKTALGLQIAHHVASHGTPVLVISLEMDEVEIMSRIVAAKCGVNVTHMESGNVSEEEQDAINAHFGELCQLPMRICDIRTNTPALIRKEAVAMKHNGGLGMILVDYIQLLQASGKTSSRFEEVSAISRDLKKLAMEMGVPVIALTQFNRSSEAGRDGKTERRKPHMSEAKESGSIEQDANMFLTLWEPPESPERDEWWRGEWNADMSFMELSIDKNRQGRTGSIPLAFDKPRMTFHNLTEGQ